MYIVKFMSESHLKQFSLWSLPPTKYIKYFNIYLEIAFKKLVLQLCEIFMIPKSKTQNKVHL